MPGINSFAGKIFHFGCLEDPLNRSAWNFVSRKRYRFALWNFRGLFLSLAKPRTGLHADFQEQHWQIFSNDRKQGHCRPRHYETNEMHGRHRPSAQISDVAGVHRLGSKCAHRQGARSDNSIRRCSHGPTKSSNG